MKTQKIFILFLFLSAYFVLFLIAKDKLVFPIIDHWLLQTESYEEKIKGGYFQAVKNKMPVWESKKIAFQPPPLSSTEEIDTKVLAADPNVWIDINLSQQVLCLFHHQGTNCFLVSTGKPWTPTPTGTYYIWIKLPATTMRGPGYYLPGVPWTMYFYRGYGIHGTYWHNNFGQPMSHGCVNMRTPEAQFVYEKVAVGTKVVIHY